MAAFLAYLLLAGRLFADAWSDPLHRAAGPEGDPQQLSWFLAWMAHSMTHGSSPLFTRHLDFPEGVNLMWNTAMPLPALLLTPVTLVAGPILAYNLVATLGPALSAWAAFLCLRRLFGAPWPAFAGGLLYGFSSYMSAQAIGHANLTMAVFPPLLLLGLDELIRPRRLHRWQTGVLLGVAAAAQLLVSEELLATGAMFGAVALVLVVLLRRQTALVVWRPVGAALGISGLVALVLSTGPLVAQFAGAQRLHGSVNSPEFFTTDLLGFVVPTHVHLLASPGMLAISDRFTGALSEWDALVGIPLLIVAVAAGFWCRRALEVRVAAAVAALAALLSLGGVLHVGGRVTMVRLPAALLERLPLIRHALPSRFPLYVFLALAVILAAWLALLAARDRRLALLAAVAVAVAMVPLLPAAQYGATASPIPGWFTGAARRLPQDTVILVAPFAGAGAPGIGGGSVNAMAWQAAADMRFRMPEGYALVPQPDGGTWGGPPSSPTQVAMASIQAGQPVTVTPSLRNDIAGDLSAWRVAAVVVGPMPHQAEMLAFFSSLLGSSPQADQGVYLWSPLVMAPPAEPPPPS